MKKSLALILALIMVLCLLPSVAFAASSNSTVVLHPATGTTPTGFKVSVGDKINGYEVTNINNSNFEITIDLGTYNVSMMSFRIPLPEEVWEGVKMQYNPQTYVTAGTAGDAQKTPGGSALLGNGKNTFYYYNLGSSGGSGEYLWKFTLNYDANGGIGAPASQFYGTNDKYTKSHTFTLATTTPTRDGYKFLGWAKDKTATSATHQPGGSYLMSQTVGGYNGGSVSQTLYAVWEENTQPVTPPERPKPENTPAIPELTELNEVVKVKCNTAPESHQEKTFGFDWFSCRVGEVINENDEYFCTITVLPNGYVDLYNQEYPGHTLDPDGQKDTLRLKWNATNKQWENTESAKLPITFTVKCDTVEPNDPPKPNEDDILRIVGNGAVKVHCDANTEHEDKIYGLLEGSFDIGDVTKDEVSGEYFCHITVHAGKYVDEYNKTYAGHTLATAGQTGMITLKWQPDVGGDGTRTWVVASNVPVVFTVKCENQTPEKPNPPEPENTSKPFIELTGEEAVKVKCTTAGATHAEKSYGLKPDGYTIGEVKGDAESGYTCDITVNPGEYVKAYNTEIGVTHTLDPESQTGTITLKWQLNDGEDGTGKWTVGSGVPVVFKVVCETGVTDKVTVSFNSNGGTAVDPQTIEKGGKATRPDNPTMGGYTFVNWYLDGEVYDFNTPVTEDITLHAQWKKNDDNPGQNPYPDPSPKPNPGGHDHGNSTVVVPITVYMPPKTGDMPFWYSIAQFLGLVK